MPFFDGPAASAEPVDEPRYGDLGLLRPVPALIDGEVEALAGKRYEHQEDRQAHRWGHEESHVVFSGKKVPFRRQRVRSDGRKEIPLERLRLFQTPGRMQDAAARQVALGVSMRDYEKAVSGVSHNWGLSGNPSWRGGFHRNLLPSGNNCTENGVLGQLV